VAMAQAVRSRVSMASAGMARVLGPGLRFVKSLFSFCVSLAIGMLEFQSLFCQTMVILPPGFLMCLGLLFV
jgi:hypothetical protein